MQRIDFEDTTITRQPYVTIDNVDYEVQEGTYQGGTDLDADTFNTLQDNIEEALSNVGGNEIAISETEPTTETTKLWINSGEVGSQASEITNSYSTSTGIGYSANYVNNLLKTTTVSGTPSGGGNVSTGLSTNNTVIVAVKPLNVSDHIPHPFVVGTTWYVHYSDSTNQSITGSTLSMIVYYYEI